jgi:hypothetical protein
MPASDVAAIIAGRPLLSYDTELRIANTPGGTEQVGERAGRARRPVIDGEKLPDSGGNSALIKRGGRLGRGGA